MLRDIIRTIYRADPNKAGLFLFGFGKKIVSKINTVCNFIFANYYKSYFTVNTHFQNINDPSVYFGINFSDGSKKGSLFSFIDMSEVSITNIAQEVDNSSSSEMLKDGDVAISNFGSCFTTDGLEVVDSSREVEENARNNLKIQIDDCCYVLTRRNELYSRS